MWKGALCPQSPGVLGWDSVIYKLWSMLFLQVPVGDCRLGAGADSVVLEPSSLDALWVLTV